MAQPEPDVFEIVITMTVLPDRDHLEVRGNIGSKLRAYGMLAGARDIIQAGKLQRTILTPPTGMKLT